jgi:hypothetical protein
MNAAIKRITTTSQRYFIFSSIRQNRSVLTLDLNPRSQKVQHYGSCTGEPRLPYTLGA